MDTRTWWAIGMLVLGTMYLWSSPAFVKPTDVRPGAPAWSERFFVPASSGNAWGQMLVGASGLVAVLFALAALGLWRGEGAWWTWAALAGALLAIVVLVPWWFAVASSAAAMTILVNVLLLLWAMGVAVVLLAPNLREQVARLGGGG